MKKRPDGAAIANELAGGASLFFASSRPQTQETPPHRQTETSRDSLPMRPTIEQPERANARTTERANGKRIITRNSFEIYEDQMDSLRERSYQEKRAGKLGSMSAMVRDAIDAYLRKK